MREGEVRRRCDQLLEIGALEMSAAREPVDVDLVGGLAGKNTLVAKVSEHVEVIAPARPHEVPPDLRSQGDDAVVCARPWSAFEGAHEESLGRAPRKRRRAGIALVVA
jgi:hypothetical protein